MAADTGLVTYRVPRKFQPLYQPFRYKIFYGGRGARKSWEIARALVTEGAEEKLRILCAREYQTSIEESVHALLKSQIHMLGLDDRYEIQERKIYGVNGTEFAFEGIKNNINNVKSLEGFNKLWVEEAQGVSKNSWEVIIPTMRVAGSEIYISFNPNLETDETYKRFIVETPPNSVKVFVTWRDNPDLSQEMIDEKNHLKKTDYAAYENVWEGKCKKQVEGALFNLENINQNRIQTMPDVKQFESLWVAVDPAGGSGPKSNEHGIVVGGKKDNHAFVIEDLSRRGKPHEWAKTAVDAYTRWGADGIVAEKNQGGEMVASTIHAINPAVPVRLVTATRGKKVRAEPIATLYEGKQVHHCGFFAKLEAQMCAFTGKVLTKQEEEDSGSPDRVDALVWLVTHLNLTHTVSTPAAPVFDTKDGDNGEEEIDDDFELG